jgi:hypothetical protein
MNRTKSLAILKMAVPLLFATLFYQNCSPNKTSFSDTGISALSTGQGDPTVVTPKNCQGAACDTTPPETCTPDLITGICTQLLNPVIDPKDPIIVPVGEKCEIKCSVDLVAGVCPDKVRVKIDGNESKGDCHLKKVEEADGTESTQLDLDDEDADDIHEGSTIEVEIHKECDHDEHGHGHKRH